MSEVITLLREAAPALATLAELRIANDWELRHRQKQADDAGPRRYSAKSAGLRELEMIQKAVVGRLDREMKISVALRNHARVFELAGVDLVGGQSDVVVDLTRPDREEGLATFRMALLDLIENGREAIRGQI